MKIITRLLALLIVLLSFTCSGKAVDEVTAKNTGANFLESIGARVNGPSGLTTVYKAISNVKGAEVVSFYVFNANPSGFVIVSGDDNVPPVLGYSKENLFNSNTTNDNVAYWLQCYEKQVVHAVENNILPSVATKQKWDGLKNSKQNRMGKVASVAPLLSTKWNQSPYYNALCPYDQLQHAHAVTGCVATAMAQVMKYWNWPTTGCGTHTYQHLLYGPQTMNFEATKFQWSAMADDLSGPDTAVALLMYAAGVSVDMQYGVSGSGANVIPSDSVQTNIASYALQTYFHYKPSLIAVARSGNDFTDSITKTQWVNMLMADIDAARPIIYAGYNATEGHCWVCDGYENDTFFHFNWGWGGLDDGYYMLNDLVDGLNQQQEAIFGIMPDSFPVYSGNIQLQAYINTTSSPVKYGQPFSLSTKIINNGAAAFNGDFNAQIFDSADNIVGTVQTITNVSIPAGDSSNTITFATNGKYDLIAGNYSIRAAYRNTGTDTWIPVADNGSYINYTVMSVANDTDIMIYQPIQIVTDTLIHGKPASVNVYVTDIGRARFTGNLDLSLYDINTGNKVYNIGVQKNLFINPYLEYQYTFTDSELMIPPGQYILMLAHQYTDSGSYYTTGSAWMQNPIAITVGGVTDYNNNNIYVYPNPAADVVYIDSYNNVLNEVRLINIMGQEVKKITTIIPNTIISIPLYNIPAGLYFVELQSAGKVSTKKIIVAH